MKFIEVERSIREKEWDMTDLHSHSHYELYFLQSGTRKFFLRDRMYKISAPCFIVISPYTMHKTEGFGFSRININVSADLLNPYELSVLKRLAEKIIPLTEETAATLFPLLKKATDIYDAENKFSAYKLQSLLSYIILSVDELNAVKTVSSVKAKAENVSPLALKTIDYLSEHYAEKISLDDLSKNFYVSKVTLCAYFKSAMNCTVGEYLMRLRINKAKQYLSSTKKNVEEISALCGFSSGAYLGLIFKQKTGLSPLQYRKLQNSKN